MTQNAEYDAEYQKYREYVKADPYCTPDRKLTTAEIPILLACFVEDHQDALKAWLEAKGISNECGMREWIGMQKTRYDYMVRIVASGVRPRGELTNYPHYPLKGLARPRTVPESPKLPAEEDQDQAN